ncbi:hypothetical protein BWI17_00535 [Betaproteobacteria bacterium GR16-43]|nr:hypothetical protein BWI17_00535 [Betaproteobacteria bacterium GR16-43]
MAQGGSKIVMHARAAAFVGLALLATPPAGAEAERPAQVTIVTDINYPPYLFQGEDGRLQGIIQDKWALWSRTTGVPVRVEGMEWRLAQESVLAGRMDVVEALAYTEARAKLYEFSPAYAPIEAKVYFHKSVTGINDAASMRGFTIAAKDGSACGNWLAERRVETIRKYPTSAAVIAAAAAGDVRLFCMDVPAAQYFLVKNLLDHDFRESPALYSTNFHWAVRKDRAALRDFIQAGFKRIPAADLEAIDRQWIGNPVRLPIDPRYAYYAGFALATIALGGLLMLAWNRALVRRVTSRTNELRRAEEEVRMLNADLERKVMERTAELAAANRDLESFSYSVSHDLRAPLRAIDSFLSLAFERGAGTTDPEAKSYLDRVHVSAQHMAVLVDSLLGLSRVSRGPLQRTDVDVSSLALEIIAEVTGDGAWSTPTVVVQPGLKASADPTLLRVALDNLIRNAFKFSSKQSSPRIEVGRVDVDGQETFFVRDNGVGFDEQYASKLFVPFERLHAPAFPGTGIGLAIVQRIVARHGGTVSAKGRLGEGATFYFTLNPR